MNKHQRGFTLIEILVALAVIATAVAAVVASVSAHVNNAAYLRERTLAHWVAMNKITELQVSGTWPGAGNQRGEALMAGGTWHWEVAVSTTDDADVRRLDVQVYAGERAEGEPLTNMVAYLGRPATGGP